MINPVTEEETNILNAQKDPIGSIKTQNIIETLKDIDKYIKILKKAKKKEIKSLNESDVNFKLVKDSFKFDIKLEVKKSESKEVEKIKNEYDEEINKLEIGKNILYRELISDELNLTIISYYFQKINNEIDELIEDKKDKILIERNEILYAYEDKINRIQYVLENTIDYDLNNKYIPINTHEKRRDK